MYRIFLSSVIMERIRKGSDLPKKKWGSSCIQQKYSHTKLMQRPSVLHFVKLFTWYACIMNSVHGRDAGVSIKFEVGSQFE